MTMKKLIIIVFVVAVVASCQNEKITPDSDTSLVFEKVDLNNLTSITQNFIPLSKTAWKFSQSSEIRESIYSKIENKFDGDFNVLFNDIIDADLGSRTIYAELSSEVSTNITMFQKVSPEEIIHPQIYIPFYEELKGANLIGTQSPVLIFRDGAPDEDGQYDGYEYFNDNLYLIGKISEDYALKNEVWVISVNERVDADGQVDQARTELYAQSILAGFTIKGAGCMKEDWVSGKVEVNAIRFFDNFSQSHASALFYAQSPPNGVRVQDVSRKACKKQWLQHPHFDFISGWNTDSPYTSLEYAYYVIFEYDPWPAGTNDVDFGNIQYEYRSYESYYDWGVIHRNSADNFSKSTGCLDWYMD